MAPPPTDVAPREHPHQQVSWIAHTIRAEGADLGSGHRRATSLLVRGHRRPPTLSAGEAAASRVMSSMTAEHQGVRRLATPAMPSPCAHRSQETVIVRLYRQVLTLLTRVGHRGRLPANDDLVSEPALVRPTQVPAGHACRTCSCPPPGRPRHCSPRTAARRRASARLSTGDIDCGPSPRHPGIFPSQAQAAHCSGSESSHGHSSSRAEP